LLSGICCNFVVFVLLFTAGTSSIVCYVLLLVFVNEMERRLGSIVWECLYSISSGIARSLRNKGCNIVFVEGIRGALVHLNISENPGRHVDFFKIDVVSDLSRITSVNVRSRKKIPKYGRHGKTDLRSCSR